MDYAANYHCEAAEGCKMYTIDLSGASCWMTDIGIKTDTTDASSGSETTPDVLFAVDLYDLEASTNRKSCLDMCLEEPGCRSVSLEPVETVAGVQAVCWLRSVEAGGLLVVAGWVTARRSCFGRC